MTTNNNIQIADTDFDSILNNFRSYLKSQDKFNDYNFDGSSMSIFLETLAYNTFYNSFYVNAIANEMFLDSAYKRENVVSRAKALGYSPSSSISSYSYIDIEAYMNKAEGETPPSSISLNAYATFTTSVQDKEFNFITPETNILDYVSTEDDHWLYKKTNVKIVEGSVYTYTWKVDDVYSKYIIPNENVDVNSLVVKVKTNLESTESVTFTKATGLMDIDETSNVYWIYEGDDEKFYIEFGNGEFGSKLDIGNYIYVTYIKCNGVEANGAKNFSIGSYSFDTDLIEHDSIKISNSNYTLLRLSNITGTFDKNGFVRGLTSGETAYVYEFDQSNNQLKLYNVSGSFQVGETIQEEEYINENLVIGATADISSIKLETSISVGGSDIEDIESIKFYAPKFFSTQNRLVTASDYETLIKHEYPYIDSIVAWGGEENDPQELGEIFVSCKPRGRETLDLWEKEYIIENIIENKKMIGSNVQIVDADYIYIKPTILLKYDADIDPSITRSSIETDTIDNIYTYCRNFCHKFKSTFYYSAFVTNIDKSNEYILGNETSIEIVKNFKPTIDESTTETLKFSNRIKNSSSCESILTSSEFTCYYGGTSYDECKFEVDSSNIKVVNQSGTIIDDIGDIDYNSGTVTIENIIVTDTEMVDNNDNKIIRIYVIPENLDLYSSKNQVLKIDTDELTISSQGIRQTR